MADYTGFKNGTLTYVEQMPSYKNKNGSWIYKCRFKCDCGQAVVRAMHSVKCHNNPSCGCQPLTRKP